MSIAEQIKHWAWRLYHVDENSKATDIGLLIIRVTVAACIFYHHGAEKFYDYHFLIGRRLDPIGIGVVPSVIFAGFTDAICSLLVLFGLFSRYAAFFLLITLNTVWWLMDNGLQHILGMPIPAPALPPGQAAQGVVHVVHTIPNYMNVPLYILGFLVIFIAGPGRYSLDRLLQFRAQKKPHGIAAIAAR